MNVDVLNRGPAAAVSTTKLAVADCDIHPVIRSLQESLYPYLSSRWQHHLETYGMSQRVAYQDGAPPYPKGTPNAARRDSWPPDGAPGTDLDFMRAQHLDANNVAFAICNPLMPSGQGFANPQLSAAMCHATNEWQKHALIARESRLRGSVVVPYEDTAASVAEIELRAGDTDFAQVLLLSRTAEPLGQPRYRPIFDAAVRAGLPVAIHAFGYGGSPVTSGGWPSYYIEEMAGHAQNSQALLSSLVIEGVFERLPGLRVIIVEAGFAWLPALSARLDKHWLRMRDETPELRLLPSEYIRQQVWLTTQPMEEPETREHLHDIIEWISWDRLLFASDYPHWDFDDPATALPLRLTEEQRQKFFLDNARALYRMA
jgi:predicted TIM-barrel fold metal-dependent hydrolase